MNIGILSIVKHICRRGTIKSWWESAEQVIVGTRNEPNIRDERPASAAGFDWRGVVRKQVVAVRKNRAAHDTEPGPFL
jgi:hypothetical protein